MWRRGASYHQSLTYIEEWRTSKFYLINVRVKPVANSLAQNEASRSFTVNDSKSSISLRSINFQKTCFNAVFHTDLKIQFQFCKPNFCKSVGAK